MPPKATEATSEQQLPSLPSPQESGQSLPFRAAIADAGLEISGRIKNEEDLETLIEILQTIKPLLPKIYGPSPSALTDPPDTQDRAQRVFEGSMTAHKEAESGMSVSDLWEGRRA